MVVEAAGDPKGDEIGAITGRDEGDDPPVDVFEVGTPVSRLAASLG